MAAISSVTDTELVGFLSRLTLSNGSSMPKFPKSTINKAPPKPKMSVKDVFPESESTGPAPEPKPNLSERLYFDDQDGEEPHNNFRSEWHEMVTAPLFTSSVLEAENSTNGLDLAENTSRRRFVSFGGLGRVISQHSSNCPVVPPRSIVYMNTNTPSTTIVCGVQGSGKSHSVSVIIENSLISSPELGKLPAALSVVVFHLGAAQGGMHLPCESAFVRHPGETGEAFPIPIKVLVSPSNLKTMRKVYADTGAEVSPFYLSTKDLNCTRMFSLMHVTEDKDTPLYMQVLQQILRDMGDNEFNYQNFKYKLNARAKDEFTPAQRGPLNLRISLLEAMLLEYGFGRAANASSVKTHFKAGTLTIVDLTDPFINTSSANALFDLALSLYLETDIPSGKLLVLDEAHKYLSNSSTPFTDSIFSVIRQQRHLGIRTVISTQEPTVVPENMLGLCSTIICHRFSSPMWWNHLRRLIALDAKDTNFDGFDIISDLKTGEGVVFCPLALGTNRTGIFQPVEIKRFGKGCLIVKIRRKLTATTGQSVLSQREE